MSSNNSRPETVEKNSGKSQSHQFAQASWWLDFWTMSGRKSENQDSLLILNCMMNKGWTSPPPLLVLLADGVSACQFPKKASTIAVQTVAETVVNHLPDIVEQAADSKTSLSSGVGFLNDEHIAAMLKVAVNKANDAMYFSQSYERVPPLLSTLSGLLCINDRIHLFHTGDSRIYLMGANNLSVLSKDHRINKGQDKGALSAALGADTEVHMQQSVFTLHQNEYLAIMTDGVYEFINPTEMQFEVAASFQQLESDVMHSNTQFQESTFLHYIEHWQMSRKLCQHAYDEGSSDNLSMIVLGMYTEASTIPIYNKSSSATPNLDDEDITIDNKLNNLEQKPMAKNKLENAVVKQSSEIAQQDRNQGNDQGNKLVDVNVNSTESNDALDQSNSMSYKLPIGFEVGESIDGFEVTKIIARTARSEVYLVEDNDGFEYVLKSPSLNTVDDGNYIRDFLKERKIGLSLSRNRRAGESSFNQLNPNNPVVKNVNVKNSTDFKTTSSALNDTGILRYYPVPASSQYLYHLTEFIDGESLRVFIERNAPCDIWQTHDLLTKIGMAVRVMHRNFLLHQDIKPENIILSKNGAVKLIDFGSTSSSILKDSTRPPVGDLHYAAPEYYTDAPKGVHSDLFSIAVIGFELLTGKLPFTTQELMSASSKLTIPTELLLKQNVPFSSQQALLRATHRNTNVRYQAIGEFLQEFNPDNMASVNDPDPLIKRNPLLVWHIICLIQFVIIIFLLFKFFS